MKNKIISLNSKKISFLLFKKGANFRGLDTIKNHKIKSNFLTRGNGDLSLTEKELIFKEWIPKRSFTISIKNISKVEMAPLSYLTGRIFPMLKIYYQDETGSHIFKIAIGFKKETQVWLEALNGLKHS